VPRSVTSSGATRACAESDSRGTRARRRRSRRGSRPLVRRSSRLSTPTCRTIPWICRGCLTSDPWLRRASARVANVIRDRVTGDRIRDTGCSLRVFRAEAVRSLTLFEGMHRFLPTLLRFHGFRVIERPVAHHPRRAGRSKYGIRNRAWLAFKDLLAVRWMGSRILKARAARSAEDRVPPRASASNS